MALKLNFADLEQLREYAKWAEESSIYYGTQANFEKRHDKLVAYLDYAMEKCSKKDKTVSGLEEPD